MSRPRPTLFLVGPLPPPVHGMALINQAVAERVRAAGHAYDVSNVAPGSISKGWWSRLRRVPVVLLRLLRFAWLLPRGGRATVYLSLSGGPGQVYDGLFLGVARLAGARIVIHHHSYRYVDRPTALASWVARVAGPRAQHVGQCTDHVCRLQEAYPAIRRTRVVSNTGFLSAVTNRTARTAVRTVGFLGNVSREKGIDDFLAVCRSLGTLRTASLGALIAGPFAEAGAAAAVRAMVAAQPEVRYLGPVYGAAKAEFFAGIDVLLFPSRVESEPLTVLEALAAGVPVIALARGCLPTVLEGDAGITVDRPEAFVAQSVRQIEAWLRSPDGYRRASAAAGMRYQALVAEARAGVARLMGELLAQAV